MVVEIHKGPRMKVSVFLHLDHPTYARSQVTDTRVVPSESPLLPGIRSVTTEVGGNWIEIENVIVVDSNDTEFKGRDDPSRVCRCGYVEPERGQDGHAYH